jgi:hypothetical protein
LKRTVIIGTPSYDGKLEAHFVSALIDACKLAQEEGINLVPIFLSYDALVQRARNDLVALALKYKVESLIFIDQDIVFEPEWILKLIASDKHVVGGIYRKKTDEQELYPVKLKEIEIQQDGTISVDGLATGFLKLSNKALSMLWEASPIYSNEGKESRMVFNVGIVEGSLYSEDNMMCEKLKKLGFKIWLDPTMCCGHIGPKIFKGNFVKYLELFPTKNKILL